MAPAGPRAFAPLVMVALVAAGVGYGLHHVPALNGHRLDLVLLAVGGALATALALALANLAPRAPAAPGVLVARPSIPAVRPAHREELDFLVAVLREVLGHGLLTQLGPRFLRGYEATFRDSPHAVALVALLDNTPVGALTGVLDPLAHRRWMWRHRGLRLALIGVAGLLARPRVALRVARSGRCRFATAWTRHRSSESSAIPAPTAVLTHVAVLSGARGCGAGRRLVEAFLADAAASGIAEATLETRGTGSFYAELGWRRSGARETAEGAEIEIWSRRTEAPETEG